MQINRIRLCNFRQHAGTHITFDSGLTGIIGANGSGKTTILEAIAWALYGQDAARGKKETIRSLRAGPNARVKVELDFELGGHRYRVERGLTHAELYLDGAELNRDSAMLLAADGRKFRNLNDCRINDALPAISRAEGRIDAGSDPESGSVSPKQPIASPAASLGSQASLCPSDPHRQMANIASEPCTDTSDRSPESAASSSRHASP